MVTEKNLIIKIKKHFKKNGFNKAVIGLSGGIDSSLACTLLVLALGKKNVFGYYLPYSNELDLNDVKILAENLGISWKKIALKKIAELVLKTLNPSSKVLKGNIAARLRMIALYNEAGKKKALVAGTGNKSELMLGYFTKFGDGGADFLPLGNLFKSDVINLSKKLKVPKSIVEKIPSAGLWPGQEDEKELGITYKKIDLILKFLEKKITKKTLSENKVTEKDIFKVKKRIQLNKHKIELPLIL